MHLLTLTRPSLSSLIPSDFTAIGGGCVSGYESCVFSFTLPYSLVGYSFFLSRLKNFVGVLEITSLSLPPVDLTAPLRILSLWGWGMVADRGEVAVWFKNPLLSKFPDIFSPNFLDPLALVREDLRLWEASGVLRDRIIKQFPVVAALETPRLWVLLLSLVFE